MFPRFCRLASPPTSCKPSFRKPNPQIFFFSLLTLLSLEFRNTNMFYSHTFLARKSPLGTIWMAAHLQHKLRKSHIAVTDISSSVDCIMFPEVPIALRLSGHLLLGVVRIYSKKVDYLYHDCTEVLTRIRTAFASIQEVNLPEDASHAPLHSITLPETFELDALDLDGELYFQGVLDNHLKTQEEITMTDQIPVEGDPYVAFFINEDIRMDTSPPAEIPEIGVRTMEEDFTSIRADNGLGVSDPGQSTQAEESNKKLSEEHFIQGLPEIEVMRDTVHTFGMDILPEWQDFGNDNVDQHRPFEDNMNDKENLSPIVEDMPLSGEQSVPFQLHSDPPSNIASAEFPENFDSLTALGHASPEIAIRPTPPIEKKAKSRKRKQLFDVSVVLTNEFIKEGLKDATKLVRKRRKLPCSDLDVWKFNKRSKMEQTFLEPSISGFCTNLQNMFKKEFITSKIYMTHKAQLFPKARGAPSPAPMLDPDMEVEHLRFEEGQVDNSSFPEFMPSPSRRDEFTPFPASNLVSEPHTELLPTLETGLRPTLDNTASTEWLGSEMDTPMIHLEEPGIEGTGLSDVPELLNSAEAEELIFLEADNTPAGHEENEKVDALSVRTRAVAQYLKQQSPATGVSKDQLGNLSMNRILEGKTRKQCARMFYETLVLKSYDLIDVQQEAAYGDITLLLTSRLLKAKF